MFRSTPSKIARVTQLTSSNNVKDNVCKYIEEQDEVIQLTRKNRQTPVMLIIQLLIGMIVQQLVRLTDMANIHYAMHVNIMHLKKWYEC